MRAVRSRSAYSTLAKVLMYDKTYALTTLPELEIQPAVGIAVAGVLVVNLTK